MNTPDQLIPTNDKSNDIFSTLKTKDLQDFEKHLNTLDAETIITLSDPEQNTLLNLSS